MINELLAEGQANARTGRELAQLMGCDIRSITEQIEKERREGLPICATSRGKDAGYFLAADDEELQAYCDRLKRRAIELFKTRQALIVTLRKIRDAEGVNNGEQKDGQ